MEEAHILPIHRCQNHSPCEPHPVSIQKKKPSTIREEYLQQIQRKQAQLDRMNCFDEEGIRQLADRVYAMIKGDALMATLSQEATSRDFLPHRVDEIISSVCLSTLNEKVQRIQKELHASKDEIVRLRSQLVEKDDAEMEMRRSHVGQDKLVTQLEITCERLRGQVNALQQNEIKLNQMIEETKRRRDTEFSDLKAQRVKDKEVYEQIIAKKQEVEKLSGQSASAIASHLKLQVGDLQAKLAQVEDEMNERSNAFEEQRSKLVEEVSVLKEFLQQERESAVDLADRCRREKESSKEELEEAMCLFQREREEKNRSDIRAVDLNEKVVVVEDDLMAALQELEELQVKQKERDSKIAGLLSQLSESNLKVVNANMKIDDLSGQLSSVKDACNEYRKKFESVEKEVQDLRQQLQVKDMKGRQSQLRVDHLEIQLKMLESKSAFKSASKNSSQSQQAKVLGKLDEVKAHYVEVISGMSRKNKAEIDASKNEWSTVRRNEQNTTKHARTQLKEKYAKRVEESRHAYYGSLQEVGRRYGSELEGIVQMARDEGVQSDIAIKQEIEKQMNAVTQILSKLATMQSSSQVTSQRHAKQVHQPVRGAIYIETNNENSNQEDRLQTATFASSASNSDVDDDYGAEQFIDELLWCSK